MNNNSNNTRPDETADKAMERLVAQDRIIVEARMLPIDRALTPDEIQSVRDALADYITKDDGTRKISNAKLAEQIEFSPGVVSEWMKGTYAGNTDGVTRAINLWIERTDRRKQAKGNSEYIKTWICEEMTAVIRLADHQQKMAVIVAPSGSGKDMVIATLAEQLSGLVITAEKNTTTPRRLVIEIAMELGLNPAGTAAQVLERVVGRLRDRSRIIFINEAQQLDPRCASTIRYVYDQTHVPIVMLGSEDIFRFIDDRASAGGQFYRRCIKLNVLNRAAGAEFPDGSGKAGRPLFTKQEVEKFLAMKRVKLASDSAFELLWRIVNVPTSGTLGMLGDIVNTCTHLYQGAALTRQKIVAVLPMILDSESANLLHRAELLDERGVAPSRKMA